MRDKMFNDDRQQKFTPGGLLTSVGRSGAQLRTGAQGERLLGSDAYFIFHLA